MKAQKITELALLATIALIVFVIEMRIPNLVPIPGVKLGLANVVTVYAIYRYSAKEVLLIVLTRIVLGAVFSGNMMALLYSLSGSLLCLAGMIFLKKAIPEQYIWLSSMFGAVLHNIGQISVAVLITETLAILAYLPILIISGCLAGAMTGLCAMLVIKRLSNRLAFGKKNYYMKITESAKKI